MSCPECNRPTWAQCQECRNPGRHFATCYVCKRRFPELEMHEHWQRDWELVCEGCYGDGEDEFADAREYDTNTTRVVESSHRALPTGETMAAQVKILSVGEGDLKVSFDPKNPAEAIRAARIVTDMLRRGYALLVEVEPGVYQRAKAFDEKTHEYIIADYDPEGGIDDGGEFEPAAPPARRRGRPRKTKDVRLKASETGAVAIARTAGG